MAKKAKYEADHVFSTRDMPWFQFYWESKAPFVELLDDADAGKVLKAVFVYMRGEEPEPLDNKIAAAVFAELRRDMDRSLVSYISRVTAGKNAPQNQ